MEVKDKLGSADMVEVALRRSSCGMKVYDIMRTATDSSSSRTRAHTIRFSVGRIY